MTVQTATGAMQIGSTASVSDDEARAKYPEGWKAPRPYIRIVPHPKS